MRRHAARWVLLWGIGVLVLVLPAVSAADTVLAVWPSVSAPPPPAIRSVSLDPATTALLLLDFNRQVCNEKNRPRCIASIPRVQALAERARQAGVYVIYSLTIGSSAADVAKALAPRPGDPAVTSGPDKFLGTDLETRLRERKIQTVVVVGTAAHGAVLYTASGAAFRGLAVVVPVDGLSAESLFAEQYVVWHMANAPRLPSRVVLTTTDRVAFQALPSRP